MTLQCELIILSKILHDPVDIWKCVWSHIKRDGTATGASGEKSIHGDLPAFQGSWCNVHVWESGAVGLFFQILAIVLSFLHVNE